ncbi:MAG TPA: TSUP family transporter [Candidatus Polarisedimenticolia bacterium]|nr:TSUP family transporter [Candidatus Polarisedimenticolia bacterium]
MDAFAVVAAVAAVIAGAIASIAGFGIGSVLTPVLSTQFDVRLAIAMVSLPHLAGTFVRFLLVRARIDRDVLLGFGAASAFGGLAGAAAQVVVQSSALAIVFALLLVFAGIGSVTGFAQRMRFSGRRSALIGGALSGLLGGLVGNQGGIRAAALLGFDVERDAFVATATAVALIVDGARIPVYLVTEGAELAPHWPLIALLALGAIAGTLLGGWTLRRMSEEVFRRVVGVLLLVLGVYTLARAFS